jgi:heptosyltransferase-2
MQAQLFEPILRRGSLAPRVLPYGDGVLVRATNWLGDSLMTLPAIYRLSRQLARPARLTVLCPAALRPVWQACDWVDQVIGLAGKRIAADEIAAVRKLHPGLGLVLPNSFGAALDVWKCRIPVRVGRRGRWRSPLLTTRLPEWPRGENVGTCHQLSYYLELAECLGPLAWGADFPPLQVDVGRAAALGMAGDNWVALAPGAAYGPAKQWPQGHFQQVAEWLRDRGLRVVLVGTGKEQAVTRSMSAAIPGVLDLAGRTSLEELMAVLAKSRAAVANDSGAMHLAAALGTSGVGIFGSTDPVGTGPLGAPWHLLTATAACRPCFRRTCPLPGDQAYQCLAEIRPEDVISALAKIL